MTPLVFAFPGCASLSASIREGLGAEAGRLAWRHFPDGESLVALAGSCADRDIVIIATQRDPDRLALALVFAARTARELGARSVGLVAPYLAYMRQDARFGEGQAVSSIHFAALISETFDWLVTVDAHLHRHHALQDLFAIPADAVSSIPLVAAWIDDHVADAILVGPDAESAQWLEPLAVRTGVPFVILSKKRTGDRDVEVSAPECALFETRTPVVFDDIISSGETMIRTLARLREAGARRPVCIAVHGLFAGDAALWLRAAGAAALVTSTTVEHPTNAIDVGPLLVAAIRHRLASRPANSI